MKGLGIKSSDQIQSHSTTEISDGRVKIKLSLPTTKYLAMVDVNLVFAAVRCEEPSHVSEAHQVRELARRGSVRGQQSHYFLPSPHHSGLWESIHISQAREPQRKVRRDDFGILWLGFQGRCLLEMRFLYYCGQKRKWLQVCMQFEGI